MCNKITVFLVLVFQSVVWQLFAAPTHNLNVENGLSNNFIHTIFQDSEGFVWIGTQFGVVSGLRRAKRKAPAFQIKTKPGIRSVY